MYAHGATELVNPASASFEWKQAHVVWKLVYLCVLTTSLQSLWSCRDETDSFFPFSFFLLPRTLLRLFVCQSWKQLGWTWQRAELRGRGSAVNEFLTVLLWGQFEYVFLIGLWRLRLLFFPPSSKVSAWCDCVVAKEPRSNGVHLKPGEHAHYLQPKARLI